MEPWQTFILGLCEHLAWPVTVILCVIVFEDDIKKVLLRLKKLPGGAELDNEVKVEQQVSKLNFEEAIKKAEEEKKETEQVQEKEAK